MTRADRLAHAAALIDRARPLSASASTARATRASPATRSPRRCSRTACGWSGARSSITGRAASSPPAPRSRTRWSSCAPARGASRTRARPRSELYDGLTPRARTAGRRSRFDVLARQRPARAASSARASTTRPSCGRRRSGRSVYEPLIRRAAGLGRAAARAGPRPLREGLRLLRRAGGRRRPGRPDGGAGRGPRAARGSSSPRRISVLGGRLLAERLRRSTARPAADWAARRRGRARGAAERAHDAAHHGVRRLRRRHLSARSSASTISRRRRRSTSRASGSGGSSRKRAVLAAGAIERPLVFAGNDRPGVMLAAAVRTYLNRFAAAPGGSAVVFTDQRRRLAHRRATRRAPASQVAADRRSARGACRPQQGCRRGDRRSAAAPSAQPAARRPRSVRASIVRNGSGAIERDRLRSRSPCPAAGIPTLHLTSPSRRQAGLGRGARRLRAAARPPQGMAVAGAAGGDFSTCRGAARRRARRRRGRRRLGLRRVGAATCRRPATRAPALARRSGACRRRGQGLRRLPERRDRRRRRARRARGLRLGRAPEALHHARHGDRPGQDLQRRRPRHPGGADRRSRSPRSARRRFRPPFTPVAIGALAGAAPRQGFPARRACTPTHDWARGAAARCSSRPGFGSGRMVPASRARPTGAEPMTREARAVRASGRRLRRLDARQDRRAGAGRGDVPRPGLHQHLLHAAGRQGALRADAARGRLRAWTTARRRGSASTHFLMTTTTANAGKVMQHLEFCHQVLWPELDVQLVSVTDQWAQYRGRRPAFARRAGASSSIAADISNKAFPLSWRCGRADRLRRRAGAAVPHLLLGRAGLRDRRAGALRRRR